MPIYTGRWTGSDKLTAHIQAAEAEVPNVTDEEIALMSLDKNQLKYNNITEDSEAVKIQRTYTTTYTTKVLVGTVPTLIQQYLIKGSVIVADDAVMTTIYVENDDYVIDYIAGTIERASVGTTIVSGATVHIWYIGWIITIKDTDYAIDYAAGTIERIAGTSIPNGAEVSVDYSHGLSTVMDDIIKRAIIEAEEFMADKMDTPDIQDEGLTTSANYYAMAIICLSNATKELKSRSDTSANLAKQWQSLADTYAARAITSFSRFVKSTDLSLDPGGVIQNRFISERSRTKISPSVTSGYRRK